MLIYFNKDDQMNRFNDQIEPKRNTECLCLKKLKIEKIKTENRRKFNIDEILDKISSLGIASLTIEERLFLDNYSNEKRD